MQPNYISQEPAFELDWLDRKAVQKLYGKAVVSEILLRAQRKCGISERDRTSLAPHQEAGPKEHKAAQPQWPLRPF